jgi:MFS family permease
VPVALDLRPLRYSGFRRLFGGSLFAVLVSQGLVVVVANAVYDLTKSSFAVGLVAAAELVPLMLLALLGGAVADAFDRRLVVLTAESLQLVCLGLLALDLSLDRPHLWAVYVLAAGVAGLSSISQPARWAITPRLVPLELYAAASALEGVTWNIAAIAGPGLGGVGYDLLDPTRTLLVMMGLSVVSLVSVASVGPIPPEQGGTQVSLRSIVDGFRFLRGKQALQGTYLLDFNAMIFGMPQALFPALVHERFSRIEGAKGYLYAAPAVGALVGSLTSGWTSRVHRHGLAIIFAVGVWGVAITAFGVPAPLWFALMMVGVAGWADMVSVIYRKTMWATIIPDELRGRLNGIAWANVRGGLLLGNVEAGAVARFTNTTTSVISGGLICVIGAVVLAVLLPRFRRYNSLDPTATLEPASVGFSAAG